MYTIDSYFDSKKLKIPNYLVSKSWPHFIAILFAVSYDVQFFVFLLTFISFLLGSFIGLTSWSYEINYINIVKQIMATFYRHLILLLKNQIYFKSGHLTKKC